MAETQKGTAALPRLLKKISVKTVISNVKRLFKGRYEKDSEDGSYSKGDIIPGQEVALMRVTGVITSKRVGETAYGAWVAFGGDIVAIDLNTGEYFRGSELLVPQLLADVLKGPIDQAIENKVPLEVAFDIGAKSNKTPMGYEFTAVPLLKMSVEDSPALKLMAQLPPPPLALAAPDTSTEANSATDTAAAAPAPAAAKTKK